MKSKTPRISENQVRVTSLCLLAMSSPRIELQAVDRTSADLAHTELTRFVDLRNPGVVGAQRDKVFFLDAYLKSSDLQKTNSLVADFLNVCTIHYRRFSSRIPLC